jgi:poly(hydroxyalkanoate) depolymerase family esterase
MMKPLNPVFAKLLGRATRLVHKGSLADVAAQLQQALRNTMARSGSTPAAGANVLDGLVREVNPRPAPAAAPDSAGGGFTSHTFGDGRHYKLFVPGGFEGRRLPLVLMLHGCTQDPDDFAAGTRMNELGQAQGVIVLYPAQPQRSNASKCWNWFQPGDQYRDRGEPAVLAGITREVLAHHPVDEERVYVAGLSAGGAMAAILGREYPELFAATGVHSGLPQGAAHDIPSAFAAMRGKARPPSSSTATPTARSTPATARRSSAPPWHRPEEAAPRPRSCAARPRDETSPARCMPTVRADPARNTGCCTGPGTPGRVAARRARTPMPRALTPPRRCCASSSRTVAADTRAGRRRQRRRGAQAYCARARSRRPRMATASALSPATTTLSPWRRMSIASSVGSL